MCEAMRGEEYTRKIVGNVKCVKETARGEFVIEVIKQAPQALRDIGLSVTAGTAPQRAINVRGVVGSGERRLVETGQRLTRAQANRAQVVVLRANRAN